jgi:hypothetical protein
VIRELVLRLRIALGERALPIRYTCRLVPAADPLLISSESVRFGSGKAPFSAGELPPESRLPRWAEADR